MPLKEAPETRFWRHVDKAGDCWMWTASTITGGYGYFHLHTKPRTEILAHRYAYELLVGPIPDGLTIDHLCRTPGCLNPAHLEPVTMRENNARSNNVTAQHARKTHCVRGHLLSGENIATRRGYRECLLCNAIRQAERQERDGEAMRVRARERYWLNRDAIRARQNEKRKEQRDGS